MFQFHERTDNTMAMTNYMKNEREKKTEKAERRKCRRTRVQIQMKNRKQNNQTIE